MSIYCFRVSVVVFALVFFAYGLGFAPPAHAQEAQVNSATISGSVSDATGNAVVGATIVLSGPKDISGKTDGHGLFVFVGMPLGTYEISAVSSTLGKAQREISVGADTNVAITYEPANGLKTIASVSTNAKFNVTPASVTHVNPMQYALEGQTSWRKLLEQIPGVAWATGGTQGAAMPDSPLSHTPFVMQFNVNESSLTSLSNDLQFTFTANASEQSASQTSLRTPKDGSCGVFFYPRFGSSTPSRVVPKGPGLVLDGGGSWNFPSLQWMAHTAGANGNKKPDLVFITTNNYDATEFPLFSRILKQGGFNSIQVVYLAACSSASDLARAARAIDAVPAVYFDGGDQSQYIPWHGSALATAVNRLYARHGVIGGSSAGLAILGNYVYGGVVASKEHVTTATADAVRDPYEDRISLNTALFHFPIMHDTITDTHLVVRDRFGRMTAFMARVLDSMDPNNRILGVGIDQDSAVVIGPDGIGKLLPSNDAGGAVNTGRALFAIGKRTYHLIKGQPLRYPGMQLTVLTRPGDTFNFKTWQSSKPWTALAIDGAQVNPYIPADPYQCADVHVPNGLPRDRYPCDASQLVSPAVPAWWTSTLSNNPDALRVLQYLNGLPRDLFGMTWTTPEDIAQGAGLSNSAQVDTVLHILASDSTLHIIPNPLPVTAPAHSLLSLLLVLTPPYRTSDLSRHLFHAP